MKEKQTRNRFKDMMWDYYLTNRQISREFEEKNKDEDPKKFNRREKIYVAVIVVGIILIAIKYLVF